jgi:hypothetical protein
MPANPITVKSVWLSAETWSPGQLTPADDAADVVVALTDGSRWSGTFVTFSHLETLRGRYSKSGECLGGRYFWAAGLVLIDLLDRPSVEAVVADMLATGELQAALQPLHKDL